MALHLQLAAAFAFLILPISCQPLRALGKNPEGEHLDKISHLHNYSNGQFQNLASFPSSPSSGKKMRWTGLVKHLLSKPKDTRPNRFIPVMDPDFRFSPGQKPTIHWFGHSSFLLQTGSVNILADPNFSGYAGPFKGLINAFAGTDAFRLNELPPIDVLLISHDHYDHLDYRTVMQLRKKVKRVVVPIGVGSHFRYWGFDPAVITEVNWHDTVRISNKVKITATPAHHRSNRSMETKKTLWASYVLEADGYKIYFSGDTGYSKHFELIGGQYGPFDLALLECGQYNQKWPQSHMFPYQTVRAAQDLGARMMIPIHWAKFAESTHPWNEPVKKLLRSADSLQVPVSVPFIGQRYVVGDPATRINWWEVE